MPKKGFSMKGYPKDKITDPVAKVRAEYIWVDGNRPTKTLRSKTVVLPETYKEIPVAWFDGSSTHQAETRRSDCQLRPVFVCPDPIRGGKDILVLCEVFGPDAKRHPTNTRALLRRAASKYSEHEPLFGIEQEYTMYVNGRPFGWPDRGYPAPQGPFYCGVGADEVFGRRVAEAHLEACLKAGLSVGGMHPEVMPGQWEFQVGPLGPLEISDQLLLARWLLYRVGEDYGVAMTLHPKPEKGDWNGAGGHTNFSTREMREAGGLKAIRRAIRKLKERRAVHIAGYGDGIEQRLTGHHETCDHRIFRSGVADRRVSIRIPLHVDQAGRGYLEDRRPCANIDPYSVTKLILETVCQ